MSCSRTSPQHEKKVFVLSDPSSLQVPFQWISCGFSCRYVEHFKYRAYQRSWELPSVFEKKKVGKNVGAFRPPTLHCLAVKQYSPTWTLKAILFSENDGFLGTLSVFFPCQLRICLRSTNKGRIFSLLSGKLFFPAELCINPAWCPLLGTASSNSDCDLQCCKHAVCLHRAEHWHLILVRMAFVFGESTFITSS